MTDALYNFIKRRAIYKQGFIDLKPVILHPIGMRLVGEWVDQMMLLHAPHARALGGMVSGAIPVAVATAALSMRDMFPFYVRKDPNGKPNPWIEGLANYQGSVVIVDDIVRSGNTMLKAAKRVTDAGFKIDLLLSLVGPGDIEISDRLMRTAKYVYLLRSTEC